MRRSCLLFLLFALVLPAKDPADWKPGGVKTYSASNPADELNLYLQTDSDGDITAWSIQAVGNPLSAIGTNNLNGDSASDWSLYQYSTGSNLLAGTWTQTDPSQIPEPSTVSIVTAGLLVVAARIRRKSA